VHSRRGSRTGARGPPGHEHRLDEQERIDRLVARHEEFGKDHDSAVAWVLGTDQRNAELVAATRDSADLVIPPSALPSPYAM
jgi:hypothetical protein